MFSKICPHCDGVSYSAAGLGAWACPYCGQDISFVSVTKDGVNHRVLKTSSSSASKTDNLIYLDQKKKPPK